ncbi:MAG: DUF1963 domain-containing protein [Sandaracinaceae bacterium]|nr:DUF1963 domain-containing protein [Sandaracinaceae bacterium]
MSDVTIPDSLRPLERAAWLPVVEPGDGDAKASKLGGSAWIPAGEEHPICPNCQRPMQLFLQLDVASLPDPSAFGGTGLLQLFYCKTSEPLCEVDCEAYFPYARSVVARRVDPSGAGAPSAAVVDGALAPQRIVGWRAVEDYPNWEEQSEAGVTLDEDAIGVVEAAYPRDGEKLGGWPRWVQGVEYPSCGECGARMRHVFQIDSQRLVDYAWGDLGVAHLTQCAEHPDRLAFGWACG